ncbi:Glycosyltransferase, group 2 family protein [Flavobacterium daejeonense]|nr:Glycosyltransferase, group 2 family protein [Flavobacterium daejeonense]
MDNKQIILNSSKLRVAAVVVTFNRKELLLKNITSCLNQTRKIDEIFIIDNASSDGTYDYLEQHDIFKNKSIRYVNLLVNQGGAGGFYHGLKLAFEEGFDLFWMMDDDGCPDTDSLEKLLVGFKEDLSIIGPLIYCDTLGLSHSKYLVNNKMSEDISEIKSVLYSYPVHPFNGTLIRKEVVEEIGFPIKELFIWGDEQEYRLRWLKAGFKEASLTNSNYYHPRNKLQFNKFWIFKTPKINKNRKYLYFRNQAFIFKKYRSLTHFYLSIFWMVLSIILFEKDKKNSLSGIKDGLLENLSDPKIN